MAHVAHSDWMFEHSAVHHLDTPVDPHSEITPDTGHVAHPDSVASVLKTLWHHADLMSGSTAAPAATGAAQAAPPSLSVAESALTVNAGGSIALPISVTPANGHATSVTITGLTSYESVTDNLDHKVFTGSAVTLSAAEVNSGLSLASNYTGTDHPVNTLTVTASETVGQHTLTSAAQTIQVTDPPTTTNGTSTLTTANNGLTLQVSGDMLGSTDPQIEVFVDGQQVGGTYAVTAHHSLGQTQSIQVAGTFDPTVAHQVQIKFINDAWDGTAWWSSGVNPDGHDVNVYVSSMSLNGQTLTGSQGTNAANNGIAADPNPSEAMMDVNGTLSFAVAAAPPSNPLTLQVSGDMLGGTDPQIQVFVDGQQVGGTYTVTAHHSLGQTQTIQVAGNFDPTVAHQVQVKFINDAWDGTAWWSSGVSPDGHDVNVYVSSISLNGQTLTGSQGTNAANNGIASDPSPNEAMMDVDGTLSFNVAVAPPTNTTGGGTATGGTGASASGSSNGLTLQVSGDMLGSTDPQIQVFVDGQQVGGTYTVTAHHSLGQTETIQIPGIFDPTVAHQVQVKFINDAWDGTSTADGHDVNVYVSSISLNGQTLNGSQGTNTANNGAVQDPNPNEAVMDVNGTLSISVPADPPAGGSTSGTSASSTGTSTISVGTGAGAVPSGPGFYVSPTGSDSNPGTLAAPFATLQRAQQAMENSSVKTTYVEGGTYNITGTINITAADNGETWAYYPPNGVNSAVLDGGNAVDLFNINGASNVTIDGIKMQHVYDYAVNSGGARSNDITIENCDIGFNQHTSLAGGFNPMIGLGNVTNAHILNNYVHDVASQGIALYAYSVGDSVDGSVISGNVVLRAVQQMNDGGAIYTDMRYTNVNGGHVTISNNYVSDYGASGLSATGIYLDDDSSNVTITGNVIGPADPGAGPRVEAILFNGGSANVAANNIIDLGNGNIAVNAAGPGGTGGTIAYGGPAAANTITGNIIISNYSGSTPVQSFDESGHVYDQNPAINSSWLTISHNLYYNYGGGAADSQGNIISDTNPVFANPQISGWAYTIASGSPAFGSMSFTPIVGGWGPQGFVIPQTGVAPSDTV